MTVSNGNIGGNVYQQANQSSSFQRWYLNPVDGQCDNNPTPRQPVRPISVLSFRGKLDPLARYDGSVGPPGRFNGAKATLAELVKIHHCQGAPIDVGGGCEIYTHCDAGVHEGLCSIEFGGHLTGDPKQSWEFLRQFTLP